MDQLVEMPETSALSTDTHLVAAPLPFLTKIGATREPSGQVFGWVGG